MNQVGEAVLPNQFGWQTGVLFGSTFVIDLRNILSVPWERLSEQMLIIALIKYYHGNKTACDL